MIFVNVLPPPPSSPSSSLAYALYQPAIYLQYIHDNAQWPNVTTLVVFLWSKHLGRHIVRRIARRLQCALLQVRFLGETEIGQLQCGHRRGRRVQQVLRLQIAMRNIQVVQILDGHANLVHYLGRFAFGERRRFLSVLNALEQLTAGHALHHDEQAFVLRICVFVNRYDLNDMATATGAPMQIDFSACFAIVIEYLKCYIFFLNYYSVFFF